MKKQKTTQTTLFWSLGIFGCLILGLSIIRQSHIQIEKSLGNANPSPPITITNLMFDQVPVHSNFQLPDPGILPTHPLYSLRMISDRIKLVTAISLETKADLLLHLSNTRIAAADALVHTGYVDQAVSAAMKGEIYLLRAMEAGKQLSLEQKVSWFNQLKPIVLKHEEVIERIHLVGNDQIKNQMTALHKNLDIYRTEIVSATNQQFDLPRPEDLQEIQATPSATLVEQPSM